MIKTAALDVTRIEPRLKHPTIFDHFDALVEGEEFEILNDHDPKPLYYQLLGERGNCFTWEYKENGPQQWRVRIAKPDSGQVETVGKIAAKDMHKADVFKKLGIDFCCGGKQTLKQAAERIGMSEGELRERLERTEPSGNNQTSLEFDKWPIGFLADYIHNVHHQYIRENGPIIEQLADKVAARHGGENPELTPLAQGLHQFMESLYSHIEHEEKQLFSFIKVANPERNVSNLSLQNFVRNFEAEHQDAGEQLQIFRTLTQGYELPANACNSYSYLFEKIKAFENDLFQHIHLENNILFPKVMQLN